MIQMNQFRDRVPGKPLLLGANEENGEGCSNEE
jgi:hypothetical protein